MLQWDKTGVSLTFLLRREAELQRFVQAVGKEAETEIREDVRVKNTEFRNKRRALSLPHRNNKKSAPQLSCKRQKSYNVTVKILFVNKSTSDFKQQWRVEGREGREV